MKDLKNIKRWAIAVMGCSICFIHTSKTNVIEAAEGLGGPPHIGTFEGSTTFTTTSSNGINPGLYLEVMDDEGNYAEYMSEDGVITIQETKEGAYVTQAKLLGKTKYMDQQTGKVLDEWEEGRDLTLVSSENPGLKTIGKNLSPVNTYTLPCNTGIATNGYKGTVIANLIEAKPNTTYTLSYDFVEGVPAGTKIKVMTLRDKVENPNSHVEVYSHPNRIYEHSVSNGEKFKTEEETKYLAITTGNFTTTSDAILIENIQLEESSTPTSYQPYQSNLLTVHENVTLRGIEKKARDTLDLITGEVVQNIGEIILDGSESWAQTNISHYPEKVNTLAFQVDDLLVGTYSNSPVVCDRFKFPSPFPNDEEGIQRQSASTTRIYISINKSRLSTQDISGFKKWLQDNPTTIQYPFESPVIKTRSLNSTYYFEPVMNREVRVNGTVLPLVASVTIPTEPLSFLLDPNQDEGQQFIAPEFSITNNTPTSIYLNLKTFKQITNVFHDVLPTTHSDWNQLDKQQSKDIALALVPIPSEGWLSLDEGPRYVADTSNYVLGEVKKRSTVDFTFSALHGQSFIEELNPKYRLAFEFGFKN